MRALIFGWNGRAQKKEQINEDHIFCPFFPGITQGNEDVVNPRFNHFVFGVNQGNQEVGGFPCLSPVVESFSSDPL